MSNSINVAQLENNFDLIRTFAKGNTLLADANHYLFLAGILNKFVYNPMSITDLQWTIEQVKSAQEMKIDHQDPKNADLLVLIGKIMQLEQLFHLGIKNIAESNPNDKEKILALLYKSYPELKPPRSQAPAPTPPRLPEPGARQQTSMKWNQGKLKVQEYALNPLSLISEMQQFFNGDKALKPVKIFEAEQSHESPFGQAILSRRRSVDGDSEVEEETSEWQ